MLNNIIEGQSMLEQRWDIGMDLKIDISFAYQEINTKIGQLLWVCLDDGDKAL